MKDLSTDMLMLLYPSSRFSVSHASSPLVPSELRGVGKIELKQYIPLDTRWQQCTVENDEHNKSQTDDAQHSSVWLMG